jgi:hypothetical protein
MRDDLGTLYQDEDFEKLFPLRGQPAECPWCLALILVMQFIPPHPDLGILRPRLARLLHPPIYIARAISHGFV